MADKSLATAVEEKSRIVMRLFLFRGAADDFWESPAAFRWSATDLRTWLRNAPEN